MVEASIQEGGVRIFEAATRAELESTINLFLTGNGTFDQPSKVITFAPQFFYESGGAKFYALVPYALSRVFGK